MSRAGCFTLFSSVLLSFSTFIEAKGDYLGGGGGNSIEATLK